MTRTTRSMVTALFASSLILISIPATNAAPRRHLPAAQVNIAKNAAIGRNGSAIVKVWQRCRNGAVAAELTVEVVQADASGSRSGVFDIVCDGRWHRTDVEVSSMSGSPFIPGFADADARFTVLDPESFDPLPQGVDSERVWLAAPAQVRVFWRGELDGAGRATLVVWARCLEPWAVSNLSVALSQGTDSGVGNTQDFGLPCDGRWFSRQVLVIPSPGSFEPGKSRANASFTVLDMSTGDPVYTAHSERNVWLVGSVVPVLWDQTGSGSGARASADLVGDDFDSQGADDFVVPAGQEWSITSVFAPGSNASTHPAPFFVPGVHVFIYEDGGDEPGALITSYLSVPPTTAPDDLTIPLSPALVLGPGTYWISVQADLSSLAISDGWGWGFRQTATGATGVWRNPGGGFGGGSEDWTPVLDWEFDLRGTSASA